MSAGDSMIDEITRSENLDTLKDTLVRDVRDTVTSETLQKSVGTLQRIFDTYYKTIDPNGYNNEKGAQFETDWNEYYNSISEEPIKHLKDALKSREDFFEHTLNPEDYIQDCRGNVDKTLNDNERGFITIENKYFNEIKNIIGGYIKSYTELFEYKSTIGSLKKGKFREFEKIRNKMDAYKQNLFMDSRKNSYENKNLDFYKSIHFYLLIIYYSAFVLFLIFSNFIQEQQYLNKKIIFYLVLYLIFPIILPYILAYMSYFYVYYLEVNNEREEIVSYPDIVNKYHDKIE